MSQLNARLGLVVLLSMTAFACGETSNNPEWVAVPVPAPGTVAVVSSPGGFAGDAVDPAGDVMLRNVASRHCLDVPRQGKESRTMLWSWDCNGTVAQKWSLVKAPQGGYRFVSRVSGKCLDVPYASSGKNINLWQFDCNGTLAQTWDVEATADGSFLIRSRASSLCVDVPHGQASNGIGVQQFPCYGGAPQRWILDRA